MLAHSLPIDPPIRITWIQTHLWRFQRSTTLSVDKVIQQTARYLTETLSELTYFLLQLCSRPSVVTYGRQQRDVDWLSIEEGGASG